MIMCAIMVSRILALLIWASVAASVAYWGLRWFAKPVAVPPGTGSVAMTSTPHGDLSKLLTGPAASASQPEPNAQAVLMARFQLLGVMAPRQQGGSGVALLVVDGKPSQAFKPGQNIDAELVVQSIGPQGVQIGHPGQASLVTLNLPLLPPATTGTLPPPAGAPVRVGAGLAGVPPMPYRPPAGAARGMQPAPPAAGMAATPVEGMNPLDPAASPVIPHERRLPPRIRRQGLPNQPPSAQGTEEQQPQP